MSVNTKNVCETGNGTAIGTGNVSETETGFHGEMGQGEVAVEAEGVADSITRIRVEIGRWQKEWDSELLF